MKVVCDNCRAVYKVPDEKLTKAVNKATCRNCGHRMLIPRPKPNADPDERTLVTAVPPTPVGAPPRSIRDDGRGPDDLRVGTPMVTARVDQTLSQPEDDFDDAPDTKLAISPSQQPTAKPEPALSRPPESRSRSMQSRPGAASMSPSTGSLGNSVSEAHRRPQSNPGYASSPGMKLPPARNTSSDSIASINPHSNSAPAALPGPAPSAGRRSASSSGVHPRATPPPAASRGPRTGGYPAMALHDPAGDLNWALLGTSTALVGGFLLAFLSVWNHPLVMWFGLAMTFGGGLLSFMVLLTGARGRRPARTFLSVVLGFMFAMVISTTLVATKWSADRLIDAYQINFSNVAMGTATPSLSDVKPAPVPALAANDAAPASGSPPPAAPDAPARPAPRDDDGAADAAPPPAPRDRTPPPRPEEPVRPPSSAAARPAPPAPPAPEPDPLPPVVPQPAPAMQNVPMDVIHVMLSNNLEVKKCFVPLLKAGALPPRVDLKFNILPSGSATNAQVIQDPYRGTEFEACLARAVGAITFPPTSGSGTSITYPFVLQ